MKANCSTVICVEVLGLSHACTLVGGLISVIPNGWRLVDSVSFHAMSLTFLAP